MNIADIYLSLYDYSNVSNTLLEAMSCGLPSLITPFEGISPELGIENNHFYKTDYLVSNISKKLVWIINNQDEAKHIGHQCRMSYRNFTENVRNAMNSHAF